MHTTITTTITTHLDIETFKPETTVNVEHEDGLPVDVAVASAIGGITSVLLGMADHKRDLVIHACERVLSDLADEGSSGTDD